MPTPAPATSNWIASPRLARGRNDGRSVTSRHCGEAQRRSHLCGRRRFGDGLLRPPRGARLLAMTARDAVPRLAVLAQLKRSALDGFLADTDRLCWMVPALLHGGAPTIAARMLSARQSRRQGQTSAVRRFWDAMIGPWIGTLLLERPVMEVMPSTACQGLRPTPAPIPAAETAFQGRGRSGISLVVVRRCSLMRTQTGLSARPRRRQLGRSRPRSS